MTENLKETVRGVSLVLLRRYSVDRKMTAALHPRMRMHVCDAKSPSFPGPFFAAGFAHGNAGTCRRHVGDIAACKAGGIASRLTLPCAASHLNV